ncbi:MAG: hypothetical protein JSU04_15775 [Bdellovibrionales bacterium]|nr:hypothetical protein [Bdellovibrionales bacterium]
MLHRLSLVSVIAGFLFLNACSTASVRVMPGEDGTNRIVSKDIEQEGAEEAAVKAANEYCEKRGQTAVFVTEKTQYKGDMDEQTRKNVRTASKVGMMLGGVGYGTRNSGVGAVLGTAGSVGYASTNDRAYQNEVVFKCK